MTIYFLRHASAGQSLTNSKQDEKRPLDKQGIAQCGYVGRALAAAKVKVDAIISSPLERATQTALLIGKAIGYEGDLHLDVALRPEAEYQLFFRMLQKYSKLDSIMVVGHNPTLTEFCSSLLTSGAETGVIDLKKGAVARVEHSKNKTVLSWHITPKLARVLQASDTPKSLPKTERK